MANVTKPTNPALTQPFYANQRQKGAYYTCEDITRFIARNTIIPFLLGAIQKEYPQVFEPEGPIWRLLRKQPERYIYSAVQCEVYLPGETVQEYTARRKHFAHLKTLLLSGDVTTIHDLITYNLDVCRFALDVMETCSEPDFAQAFYTHLTKMTVLDPSCGSGAFLLAAFDALELLYKVCYERLHCAPQKRHAAICRAIISQNLYGVDIMEEAVEICKLRLFLKLLSRAEHMEDLKALPDINFNIRTGNMLVGYINAEEARKAALEVLSDEDCTNDHLDRRLAKQYGVVPDNTMDFVQWRDGHKPFHWLVEFPEIMRQGGFDVVIGNPPYVEYQAIQGEYTLLPGAYETETCGNLYAFCMERITKLGKSISSAGLIVPLSLVCTERMATLRRVLYTAYTDLWCSNYDTIPGTLFSGIVQRNTIIFAARQAGRHGCRLYTTRNHRWRAPERATLFELVRFAPLGQRSPEQLLPKVSTELELAILRKIEAQAYSILSYTQLHSSNRLLYKRRWSYFLLFAEHIEGIVLPDGSTRRQRDIKELALQPQLDRSIFLSLLNSSLFYFHYSVFSDSRHVNRSDFSLFMFDYKKLSMTTTQQLSTLGRKLTQSFADNVEWRVCEYGGSIGTCRVPFYLQGASKAILDEIDTILAQHYGLTDEELDFIINYDGKYRMRENHHA